MTTKPEEKIDLYIFTDRDGAMNVEGLTKREYFSALAMQGLCANEYYASKPRNEIVTAAVDCADALIEALNKNG